ncbi:MAG: hypothetical protein MUF49_23275 [Oculatellaceae cyanobacterium Prado106]|jgi:DNA-binding response OmpR family regulator|nr:hypothetical protein [Oculatellaceae cyanobacterium Prado106]
MKTILIMMQNDDLRLPLADWISLEGFDVVQTNDAIAGLRIAEVLPVEIIFCDLEMLEMDSFKEKLRCYSEAHRENQTSHIIAISDSKSIVQALALGADDFLFSGAQLYEFLQLAMMKLRQA